MQDEALADISSLQFGTIEFQLTIFVAVMVLWMRMYLHYIG